MSSAVLTFLSNLKEGKRRGRKEINKTGCGKNRAGGRIKVESKMEERYTGKGDTVPLGNNFPIIPEYSRIF